MEKQLEQGETIVVMVIVYHEELEKQGETMIVIYQPWRMWEAINADVDMSMKHMHLRFTLGRYLWQEVIPCTF